VGWTLGNVDGELDKPTTQERLYPSDQITVEAEILHANQEPAVIDMVKRAPGKSMMRAAMSCFRFHGS
jgi:hypothetical protein